MNKHDKQTITRAIFGLQCEVTGFYDCDDVGGHWFEVTKIVHKGTELKDVPSEIYEELERAVP